MYCVERAFPVHSSATFEDMRTTWNSVFKVTLAALAATLLLAGCGGDDADTNAAGTTSTTTEATADTTTETTTLDADVTEVAAFCDEVGDPSAEVAESYVGSEEHVEDLQRLRDVSPDELVDDLDAIISYFEDEVDPADPDSQLIENFPDEVVEATGRVTAFTEENCGA